MAMATAIIGLPTVIGVDDTLPVPSVTLEGVADLTDHSATLDLFTTVAGVNVVTQVAGVIVDSAFEFAILAADTADPIFWRSYVVIDDGAGGVYTLPGPSVAVVDYAALWALPSDVPDAEGRSNSEVVMSILAAEEVVRAWVATAITSPVSERVRRAVALLASRALSSSVPGDAVLGETFGDYSIRYAEPGRTEGMVIDSEIEQLLEPWGRGKAYSTYTGPDGVATGFFASDLYVDPVV